MSKLQDLQDLLSDLHQVAQDYKDEAVGATRAERSILAKGAAANRERIKRVKAQIKDAK